MKNMCESDSFNQQRTHDKRMSILENISNSINEAFNEFDSVMVDYCMLEIDLLEKLLDPTVDSLLESAFAISTRLEELGTSILKEYGPQSKELSNMNSVICENINEDVEVNKNIKLADFEGILTDNSAEEFFPASDKVAEKECYCDVV